MVYSFSFFPGSMEKYEITTPSIAFHDFTAVAGGYTTTGTFEGSMIDLFVNLIHQPGAVDSFPGATSIAVRGSQPSGRFRKKTQIVFTIDFKTQLVG